MTLPMFAKISSSILRAVYSTAFYISTTKNQIIYKQGEKSTHFYIVKRGEFAVS